MSESVLHFQRADVNPYRSGAKMIADRFRWDLKPCAFRSRSQLRTLKDSHPRGKAVIMCTGPSLNNVDFELLKGVYCFGLNRVNLLFDRTDFRPNSVVSMDLRVIEQNIEFLNSTDLPLFITSEGAHLVKPRANVTFLHPSGVHKFARDVSFSLFGGYSVTFTTFQLAFHMGFTDVALVGADHNYASSGPQNSVGVSDGSNTSYFDKNYLPKGSKFLPPQMRQIEVGYELARETYAAFGRRTVNATDGGHLEIFERMSLKEFVAS